jgi:hypothetical protein
MDNKSLNARDAWSYLIIKYANKNINFLRSCTNESKTFELNAGLAKDNSTSNFFQLIKNLLGIEKWDEINDKDYADFISFKQSNKDNTLRLEGIEIAINYIDSHNFITSLKCIDSRWVLDRYDADAVFAIECYKNAVETLYIPKVLSVYNSLK